MKPQPSAPSAAAPLVVKNYDTAQAEALGPLSLAVLLATLSFCESVCLLGLAAAKTLHPWSGLFLCAKSTGFHSLVLGGLLSSSGCIETSP
jgi:hypothetical protein